MRTGAAIRCSASSSGTRRSDSSTACRGRVTATFAKRATPYPATISDALTPAFFESDRNASDWRSYLAANRLTGAPPAFTVVGEAIRTFLGPVLEAAAGRAVAPGRWEPGGPWRPAGGPA
ncbi:MAG: hypothetical protein K8T90_13835 [Planctomycetes bacterium]|nr:hypothetical protein [Planctomycetota bacterium]